MKTVKLLSLVATLATAVSFAPFALGEVTMKTDAKGESVAVLQSAHGTCEVMLRGAHVTACAFAGDAHPLLYVPKMGYVAKPGPRDFIHGGVPLLWPWFGSSGAPADPKLRCWARWWGFPVSDPAPFHATGRLSLFKVKETSATSAETSVTLELTPCAEVSEYTEGDFLLTYRITLGDHLLRLELTTTNRGEEIFRYREGYHPYFAVADCYKVVLDGVDGCWFESSRDLPYAADSIWRGKVPEWPGCDLFKFKEPRSVITLEDPVWKRDIVLTTDGARDVVTWCQDARGAAKGTMNIGPEECRSYFCIEPSNFYAESEIALQKGESHTFKTEIRVKGK